MIKSSKAIFIFHTEKLKPLSVIEGSLWLSFENLFIPLPNFDRWPCSRKYFKMIEINAAASDRFRGKAKCCTVLVFPMQCFNLSDCLPNSSCIPLIIGILNRKVNYFSLILCFVPWSWKQNTKIDDVCWFPAVMSKARHAWLSHQPLEIFLMWPPVIKSYFLTGERIRKPYSCRLGVVFCFILSSTFTVPVRLQCFINRRLDRRFQGSLRVYVPQN